MAETNPRLKLALPFALSVTMALGMMAGYKLRERTAIPTAWMQNAPENNLQEVLNLIQQRYVDPGKIDSIQNKVIKDLLAGLDPHSIYIPDEEVSRVNEEMKGSFGGIGIEYQLLNDTVTITALLKNGPGQKGGLQTGDKIIGIAPNQLFRTDSTLGQQVRNALRGEAGSKVKIIILRNGKRMALSLTRSLIPLPALTIAYMLNDTTGYIGLSKFSETVYPEFMQALEKLQKSTKLRHLVLDLRNNGGGLLDGAVQIADEFLNENKLITYTEGAKSSRQDFRSKRPGLYEEGKLTVLINENSASASEILAGALQDWDRATLVGRRSFGKGLVQQQFGLSSGSELRLTIARYYTPLGRNIQKSYAGSLAEYEQETARRGSDSAYTTDASQARKSYRTPAGRTLYDGGGINPDILANEPSLASEPQALLHYLAGGQPEQIALAYWQFNKVSLEKIKSLDALLSDKSHGLSMQNVARKAWIYPAGSGSPAFWQEIEKRMISRLVKYLFGPEASLKAEHKRDKAITLAIHRNGK